jgi:UTP:GlnB (protein PII) uridylyltransferase
VTVERRDAFAQARLVQETRYPTAAALLLAGSTGRGETTAHSDLDLVVLYEQVPHAWRESFVADDHKRAPIGRAFVTIRHCMLIHFSCGAP